MNILMTIAEKTKERIEEKKRRFPDPFSAVGEPVLRRSDAAHGKDTREPFFFEHTIRKKGLSFICEVKKASPSKGLISPDFPYLSIARSYEAAGADCISCLTEPYWFLGQDAYLSEIRRETNLPILRKDFTVDEYMIREAKAIGADAVLFICSILDPVQLKDYIEEADELGLTSITEAHSAREVEMAVNASARVIGVNNRNLTDFSIDQENARRLRGLIPDGTLFISESGVKSRQDVISAQDMRADAVLIGETLMRAGDKARKLAELSARPPKIKFCGLMTEQDVEKVNALHADYAGFVFAKGRHRINTECARLLKNKLSPGIAAVGVFVDEDPQRIISLLREGTIDIAQLHGSETEDTIRLIRESTGRPVIRALLPENGHFDTASYPSADYFLLDAGKGSGKSFDLSLIPDEMDKPFFLAGGLTPSGVSEAIRTSVPFAVDVSSGVEDAEGRKDYNKMREFTAKVRKLKDTVCKIR